MSAAVPTEYDAEPLDWERRGDAFALPKGAIYLDAAARGPLLCSMQTAAHRAIEAAAAPWRLPFDAWHARIEDVRGLAAGLLDDDPEGVALVPSVAHGLATAARNLPLQRGDAVLVLEGQFPSNLLVWQQRCAEVGARVVTVAHAPGQDLTAAVLAALQATPALKVVALPQVYWHDGRPLELDRIAAQVHAHGAALVLDLSQSLGVLTPALARWRPAFVVAVGHKWLLGPMGLAWLWAAPHWREHGVAIEQHWQAREAGSQWTFPSDRAPPYRHGARRFDAGGVADPLRLAMAAAALRQVRHWRPARIADALGALTGAFDVALAAHGLDAWRTPAHAPHLTALRPPPARLDAVAAALARAQVICTRRHGCLRIAPHLSVDAAQVHAAVRIAATA